MPRVDMTEQDRIPGQGQGYTESPEEKKGWQDMIKFLAAMKPSIIKGGTFLVKGYISEILLAPGNKYFVSDQTNDDGTTKAWQHVKACVVIADDRVSQHDLPLPPKKVGANFFDGWNMKKGTRSNLRGGMYTVHLATKHQEPPQELVRGNGSWDTADYEGPENACLIRVQYDGVEPKDSQYYGRRGNLRLFVQGFERDPDLAPESDEPNELAAMLAATDDPGDTMQEPEPAPKPQRRAPGRSTAERAEDEVAAGDPNPRAGGGSGRTGGRSATTAPQAASASGDGGEDEDFFSLLQTEPAPTRGRRNASNAGAAAGDSAPAASTATVSAGEPRKATERQVRFMFAIAREAGLDDQELVTWSQELFGADPTDLNTRDASSLIEALQRRRNEVA